MVKWDTDENWAAVQLRYYFEFGGDQTLIEEIDSVRHLARQMFPYVRTKCRAVFLANPYDYQKTYSVILGQVNDRDGQDCFQAEFCFHNASLLRVHFYHVILNGDNTFRRYVLHEILTDQWTELLLLKAFVFSLLLFPQWKKLSAHLGIRYAFSPCKDKIWYPSHFETIDHQEFCLIPSWQLNFDDLYRCLRDIGEQRLEAFYYWMRISLKGWGKFEVRAGVQYKFPDLTLQFDWVENGKVRLVFPVLIQNSELEMGDPLDYFDSYDQMMSLQYCFHHFLARMKRIVLEEMVFSRQGGKHLDWMKKIVEFAYVK